VKETAILLKKSANLPWENWETKTKGERHQNMLAMFSTAVGSPRQKRGKGVWKDEKIRGTPRA